MKKLLTYSLCISVLCAQPVHSEELYEPVQGAQAQPQPKDGSPTRRRMVVADPVVRAALMFNSLKRMKAEDRPKEAMTLLAKTMADLNEKDHNKVLFELLSLYQKDFDNRDFIIEVLTLWEEAGKYKTEFYAPPSGWYHTFNIIMTTLGALTAYRMIKNRFITPPLKPVYVPNQMNSKLRNFLDEKIAKVNLRALTSKANLLAGAGSFTTSLGMLLILHQQFYDAVMQGLAEHFGPEEMDFMQALHSTKIPPNELWQMVDVAILCENHGRLVEISKSPEITKTETLVSQERIHLMTLLEEINEHIEPNLESIRSNIVNKKKANQLMLDGMEPKNNKQLQFAIKNTNVKDQRAKKYGDKVLMCDQTSLEHTLNHIKQLKSVMEEKIINNQ